jgi:hypothetical protein
VDCRRTAGDEIFNLGVRGSTLPKTASSKTVLPDSARQTTAAASPAVLLREASARSILRQRLVPGGRFSAALWPLPFDFFRVQGQ